MEKPGDRDVTSGRFVKGWRGGPGRPRLHPLSKAIALVIREIDDPERVVWWYLCFITGVDPDRAHPTDPEGRVVWEWARDHGHPPTEGVPVVFDHRSRLRAQTTLVAYAHGLPAQFVQLQATVDAKLGGASPLADPAMAQLDEADLERLAAGEDVIDAVAEVRPLPPGLG